MIKIKADTIARTILLGLALVNQILAVMGKDHLPFTEDQIYQTVSLLCTVITAGIAWWKNNSFTPAALATDLLKDAIKKQESGR